MTKLLITMRNLLHILICLTLIFSFRDADSREYKQTSQVYNQFNLSLKTFIVQF